MQDSSSIPRKRIHNPRTGKYYALRIRSSSKGRRGTIKGLWKPPKKRERVFQDVGEHPFHFYRTIDDPLGLSVTTVAEFKEQIRNLDIESLKFHMYRGDFAAWLHYIGASRLAQRTENIELDEEERLREQLVKALDA